MLVPIRYSSLVTSPTNCYRRFYVMQNKYRVVTFQSHEVIRNLIKNGLHLANKELMREGSISDVDIANCDGNIPIWVFQHPAFRTTNVGYGQWCEMLGTFRCEMSISSLSGLFMIELLLDRQPPKGIAHNDSSLACVVPKIDIKDVAAIYYIGSTSHWYFYDVIPVYKYKDVVLFPDRVTFNEEDYSKDDSPRIKLINYKSAEDYYKEPETTILDKDLFL